MMRSSATSASAISTQSGHATCRSAQDDTRHFTLHAVVDSDEDMRRQFETTVAMPVDYEMLYVGKWKQNLLLADGYRKGRVFLAGDSAHLVIPTGGLGMNTGVGDALDLSWKLAATLQGWGGDGLLVLAAEYEDQRGGDGEDGKDGKGAAQGLHGLGYPEGSGGCGQGPAPQHP